MMQKIINSETRVRQADSITTQDLGDEVMLYDAGRENVHILNPTAQKIWKLCDGRHTVGEMADIISREFSDVALGEITDDIAGILTELHSKHLVAVI